MLTEKSGAGVTPPPEPDEPPDPQLVNRAEASDKQKSAPRRPDLCKNQGIANRELNLSEEDFLFEG